jgi:hypothetical protein
MIARRGWPALFLVLLDTGCTLGPRRFFDLTNPAPLVRARAAQLGDRMPESVVIPRLIDRLDDPDPVVRMTAHEELRERTGQDFGYLPWGDAADRVRAVTRWRSWWNGREAGLVKPRPLS